MAMSDNFSFLLVLVNLLQDGCPTTRSLFRLTCSTKLRQLRVLLVYIHLMTTCIVVMINGRRIPLKNSSTRKCIFLTRPPPVFLITSPLVPVARRFSCATCVAKHLHMSHVTFFSTCVAQKMLQVENNPIMTIAS